ncbi:MAG: hypothetical protein L0287_23610, partial [Anaerolineae bacterium]|nr:hypothetical protein [Anaerolineae bacterium]
MKYSVALTAVLIIIISCRQIEVPIDPPPDDDSTETYYTYLEGSLQGTLAEISSPYFAGNPIWVDSLKTLTIEPGVEIYFGIPSSLEIRSRLVAVGNASNPILFTAYQNYFWKGITVSNSQQNSVLQFAIFENIILLSEDSLRNGSIELENASATIQNCIIRYNRGINGGGIAVLNSSGIITNNLILNNEASAFGGAIFSFQSTAKIINNTIYGNSSFNHGGGVVLYNPILDEVQNNILY